MRESGVGGAPRCDVIGQEKLEGWGERNGRDSKLRPDWMGEAKGRS